MEDRQITFMIQIVIILISLPTAFSLNTKQQQLNPSLLPYKWGYFTGVAGILSYVILAFLSISHDIYSIVFALIAFAAAIPFTFIIKRHKWAWIAGSILSLNPIVMIFNYYYLKKRWGEMSGQYAFATSVPPMGTAENQPHNNFSFSNYIQSKPFIYRIVIFGTILWILIVLSYVLLFEPYGYMSDDDIIHMIKVTLFPPSVAWFSFFLYSKFFKTKY